MEVVVIGATGLTGSFLIPELLDRIEVTKVIALARKPGQLQHQKLSWHQVDFNHLYLHKQLFQADALISCMGTTIKRAGSPEEQRKIDIDYTVQAAEIAKNLGCKTMLLLSSVGASQQKGTTFYLRLKGELEAKLKAMQFQTLLIFQPGQLDGPRNENRVGEKIGLKVMKQLNCLGIFKHYQPIHVAILSHYMVNALLRDESGEHIYRLNKIKALNSSN